MTPEQNNMEDLFRSAFENASLEPPHKEEMWDEITFAIQKPPVPIHRTVWFRVSSIAASVALLFGIMYYTNTSEPIANEQVNILNTPKEVATEDNQTTPLSQDKIASDEKINDISTQEKTTNSVAVTKDENIKEKSITQKEHHSLANKQDNTSVEKVKTQSTLALKTIENKEATEQKTTPIAPKQVKEENTFSLVRFEVKEIVTLIPADLSIPFILTQQPVIQLVIIEPKQPVQEEKTKLASNYWIGFGGFYNTYQPNFGFTSSGLPSPLISSNSGIASVNYGKGTDVASQLRENLSVESANTVNFDFGKILSNHWFVRTGLGLTNNRYIVEARVTNRLGDIDVDADPSIVSDKQNKNPAIYHDNYIRNATSILNIPVQIGFQSNLKTLNFFISSGLGADIILNHSLSNTFRDASYNFGNYKAINISAIGSAGLIYNVTPHFSTLLEFNYRRSITSVYDSPNLQSHPQWIGIGIGIRKKF